MSNTNVYIRKTAEQHSIPLDKQLTVAKTHPSCVIVFYLNVFYVLFFN